MIRCGSAAAARQFRLGKRILGPPMFPELRELDPRSSWLSPSPRRRRVRIGVLGVLLLGIQPLDDFGHEEQLLIGRGCIPLATLAEHRPLEEPQLLGGLRQLLLASGDDFLLLRDDRLLVGVPLLQLTNPLLAGRQLIGKRWTSVLHALLNARHRHLVLLARRIFFGAAESVSCTTPSRTTPHTGQVDAFQDQRQIAQSHLDSGRRSRTILPHSPRCFRHFKGSAFQVACTK